MHQGSIAYFFSSACTPTDIRVHWRLLPKGNFMAIAALSSGISGLTTAQRAPKPLGPGVVEPQQLDQLDQLVGVQDLT